MRFSIIMPVYNVENYIRRCMESILNQDFTDYEIIVVDDETPDNSMQIVDEFAQACPDRFHIIHQKNRGNGGARNVGASAAKGEYIFFIDSDDYLADGMLRAVDAYLSQSHADMLMFNFNSVTPAGKLLTRHLLFDREKICNTTEQKQALLLSPPQPWNKIFRREFYLECQVLFPERTLYEDIVTRIFIAKAKSIHLANDYFYNYVQRPGSIMNSVVSPRVLDIIKMTDLIRNRFSSDGLDCDYKDALDAAQTHAAFSIAESVYRQAPGDPMQKQIVSYIVDKFPDFTSNHFLQNHIKRELTYFIRKQYGRYHCAKKIYQFKSFLMQNPILYKLNELRRKIGV